MAIITSFEVLAQPIVPGIADIPYVQQGSFLQISNIGSAQTIVTPIYQATPAFVVSSGAVSLFANYIDNAGNVTQFPAGSFISPPVGFGTVAIPAGATFIFGVQYVLSPGQSANLVGGTPQDGLGTRGYINLNATSGSSLLVLATIRQVFTNYDSSGNVMDVSEAAYSVPLVGGPLQSF